MNKKLSAVLIALAAASFLGALALYPAMPAIVPIHWNAAGQIDGFGRKWVNLVLAAVPLACAVGLTLLPRLDPRGKNYQKHTRAWAAISISVVLIFAGLSWVVISASFGHHLPVSAIVSIMVGALMVAVGNYMPQLRSNYFAGFRTPWALSSETVWRKTQRAGGIVLCAGGLLLVGCAFLGGTWAFAVPMAALLAGTAGVTVYSFVLYRKLTPKGD